MLLHDARLATAPEPTRLPGGPYARFLAPGISRARAVSAPALWLGRIAIALVYVWFGGLKVAGLSPAAALVAALQREMLPFFDEGAFLVGLGIYEVLVGVLLLIGQGRIAFALLGLHMVTTFLPLLVLPGMTWEGFPVLTIEGQYIVKNVVIVALAFALAAPGRRTCEER